MAHQPIRGIVLCITDNFTHTVVQTMATRANDGQKISRMTEAIHPEALERRRYLAAIRSEVLARQ